MASLFPCQIRESKSNADGCIRKLDPEYVGYAVQGYDGVYVRAELPDLNLYPSSPSTLPLLQRAWVYQEIQLSQRVLLLGVHGVAWECRQKRENSPTTAIDDRKVGRSPQDQLQRTQDQPDRACRQKPQ